MPSLTPHPLGQNPNPVPAPSPRRASLSREIPRRVLDERLEDQGILAEGGMCTIHQAFDRNLLRTVAMKVLRPRFARDPAEVQRFFEEAQITGQLDHPNIPAVHEVGVNEGGLPFMTMKLVRGKTLAEILREPEFSPADQHALFRVLQIFLKICQAVSFAHSRGVFHCDLKPANVMVGSHGQVYVMDWGFARLSDAPRPTGAERVRVAVAEADTDNDDSGKLLGTVAYMAPEQARGDYDAIDERTDVFQLGALLYRALAGHAPYRGRTAAETLALAMRCAWRPPQQVNPEIPLPKGLCAIAARAMAFRKEERYQSAEALEDAVEAFLRGAGRHPSRTYAPGELIVREGDAADEAYVITRGSCLAFKEVDGRRLPLRTMTQGEVFGEAAIFVDSRRTASVEALEPTTVAVVDRGSLEQEIGETHLMGYFVKALAERFRDVDERATRLHRETQEHLVARMALTHLAATGVVEGDRRSARLSPLLVRLRDELGLDRAEALALLTRAGGLSLEQEQDRVVLGAV